MNYALREWFPSAAPARGGRGEDTRAANRCGTTRVPHYRQSASSTISESGLRSCEQFEGLAE